MPEPRIAIAYDCFFPTNGGGGERVYRSMAEALVARGSRLTYVTRSQWSQDGAPHAPFDIAGVWRGEIYDERGVRTARSALAFAAALFRHFIRNRDAYDVVVLAALPVLNVFAVRAALLGTTTMLVIDWLEVWSWRKWCTYAGTITGTIAAALQWLALHVGDLITVNSAFTRERVRRYRRRADPIVLGLVDLVGADADAPVDSPAHPTVFFAGRHIADKRLDRLPAAVDVARRSIPSLTVRIAGTGPETERIREAARVVGVADAIAFLGRIDDLALKREFAGSSVLVNPSAREGFGLVVAEAAAEGTPSVVVAGADNAAVELIEPGVNGFVAGDASPEVLGAAIVAAIGGGSALRRSTLAWFEREREHRSLRRSVDELLSRYASYRARSKD
jgi:glycosyltransferase involved in cell wall biosynthesis